MRHKKVNRDMYTGRYKSDKPTLMTKILVGAIFVTITATATSAIVIEKHVSAWNDTQIRLQDDILRLNRELIEKNSTAVIKEALWWSDSSDKVISSYLDGEHDIAQNTMIEQQNRLQEKRSFYHSINK